jgi:hypothetical protein
METYPPAAQTQPPPRDRVALALLFFGLGGGAAAWIVHLIVSYVLASRFCFPHDTPRSVPLPGSAGIEIPLLTINLACLTVALAAAAVSLLNWRRAGRRHSPAEGEPRRFLAAWGSLADLGFVVAILVSLLVILTVPQCGG